jgi:hypothetical protein
MTDTNIVLRMAPVEADQLARLVDELKNVIASGRDGGDPAVSRLTPSPYPDDRTASEEFEASTRDDLLDRRAADAETMLSGLSGLRSLVQDEAFEERDLRIAAEDVDPWMRTLTALRLVLASRLASSTSSRNRPATPSSSTTGSAIAWSCSCRPRTPWADRSRNLDDSRRPPSRIIAIEMRLLLTRPSIPVWPIGVAVPRERPGLPRRLVRLHPHPHVRKGRGRRSEDAAALHEDGASRIDRVALRNGVVLPVPPAPRPGGAEGMRSEDRLERVRDAAVESVPARIDRVHRDELDRICTRPGIDDHPRESRLARTAPTVDQHDRGTRADGAHIIDDQTSGATQRDRDRVVTS